MLAINVMITNEFAINLAKGYVRGRPLDIQGGLGFSPLRKHFISFTITWRTIFFQRHIQSNILFLQSYQIEHFIFHPFHVVTVKHRIKLLTLPSALI